MPTPRAPARVSTRIGRTSTRIRRTSSRQGPRAPSQLVERMVTMAGLVVVAYTDRLMRALEPLLQERYGQRRDSLRQDAAHSIDEVFSNVREGEMSKPFLERMFHMVDQQAASDLQRVVPVPLSDVLPRAAELQRAWVEKNTGLIRLEERAQKEVRAIIEAPIVEGVRVEEIRARIQERMGVVRSRAELIARDQTLKLYGNVQEERQTEAGIVEYTWSTSDDERVRKRHIELEGTTQRWDSPPVVDPRTGRREHPGGDFQCLPGVSRIGFSGPVNGAFRRWYAGELTLLVTDTGEALECTPNHPILTATGWQAAKSIQVGNYVFATREHGAQPTEAHVKDSQSSVAEVFEALALAFGVTRPGTIATQFHGDASVDEHVDVVNVDSGLRLDLEPTLRQVIGEFGLPKSNPSAASLRKADLVLDRLGFAAASSVGVLRLRLAQLFGRLSEPCHVGGPAIARLHAVTDEQIADGLALGSVALGQAFDGHACSLEFQAFFLGQWLRIVRRSVHVPGGAPVSDRELADRLLVNAETGADVAPAQMLRAQRVRVVETAHRQFLGHVFNLSTDESWYVAQGILTHNCRCAAIPILPTGDEPPISETRPSVRAPANDITPEERALAEDLPVSLKGTVEGDVSRQVVAELAESIASGKSLRELGALETGMREASAAFIRSDPGFALTGALVSDPLGVAGLPTFVIEGARKYLANGRHRLSVARALGLTYFQAVIEKRNARTGKVKWRYVGKVRV